MSPAMSVIFLHWLYWRQVFSCAWYHEKLMLNLGKVVSAPWSYQVMRNPFLVSSIPWWPNSWSMMSCYDAFVAYVKHLTRLSRRCGSLTRLSCCFCITDALVALFWSTDAFVVLMLSVIIYQLYFFYVRCCSVICIFDDVYVLLRLVRSCTVNLAASGQYLVKS